MSNLVELLEVAIANLGDHIGQSQLIIRRLARLKEPEILSNIPPESIRNIEIRVCHLLAKVSFRCGSTIADMYGEEAAKFIVYRLNMPLKKGSNND